MATIDTLFLDVGGVILTNGWDHGMREAAAKEFGFDYEEFSSRHRLVYPAHELGHLTLEQYLDYTLFYRSRPFSKKAFVDFMKKQSEPLPCMLEYLAEMKERFGLRLVAVSNEGRELILHRIHQCGLKEVLDFFIISCFIGFRKPDPLFYRLALDLSQSNPKSIVYIDDRAALVDAAQNFGFRAFQHTSFDETKATLDGQVAAAKV